ncbi:protein AGENET DOMAIN (AGD)-CONTAINING P1-like [Actinidia eriantha]|uniref:protein AGENET DOMAIN (AGD)-CONTAINING P1-like n=1 Tax=Actinidia eriantha TaxID=165200 RepID=UPI0025903EDE|nr:protein AGENET DOMAIN (AGD)-CONTAINING P1-like [Actinidia eriantha]XP_057465614.1 protein AGENET DOMAIN (AGD)-CONTAINING P1-like [Actinidia eriantha]
MCFCVGSHVEICSNEDGFLGSYYEAKIVAKLGKDRLKVEYTTLLADNQKGPLKEIVRASDVRPVPPQIRASAFNVMDKVDAYDLDGWWVGRVTGRKIGSKYTVYFECSGDEYDYPASALRVHQEYVDGHWVPSQQKDPFVFGSR